MKSSNRKNTGNISQETLIFSYYEQHPNQPIPHAQVVDWAVNEWQQRTGKVFRDPDRAIRKLHQQGLLVKVSKGVYKYDPTLPTQTPILEDFTPQQKQAIFRRDDFKCVICGKGKADGVDIHADHIKPKDKGGKAIIDNGQTLCSPHNMFKKNYDQTESGKRFFIRLRQQAIQNSDTQLQAFTEDILRTYQRHDINGHIDWY